MRSGAKACQSCRSSFKVLGTGLFSEYRVICPSPSGQRWKGWSRELTRAKENRRAKESYEAVATKEQKKRRNQEENNDPHVASSQPLLSLYEPTLVDELFPCIIKLPSIVFRIFCIIFSTSIHCHYPIFHVGSFFPKDACKSRVLSTSHWQSVIVDNVSAFPFNSAGERPRGAGSFVVCKK